MESNRLVRWMWRYSVEADGKEGGIWLDDGENAHFVMPSLARELAAALIEAANLVDPPTGNAPMLGGDKRIEKQS